MRKPIAVGALVLALLVCLPGVALASSGSSGLDRARAATGGVCRSSRPRSATVPPPASRAMPARRSPPRRPIATMLAIHAREHPLPSSRTCGSVTVARRLHLRHEARSRGRRSAAAVGSPRYGRARWRGRIYARGDFATLFGSWWVLVPFSLLFLLPFLDPRRPWRILHLDALVLLSLLGSYLLFDHAKLVPAVWMVYPPLLYLAGAHAVDRLGLGVRRRRPWTELSPRSRTGAPHRLVALVAARIVLSLVAHTVVDTGYASVIGAHRIIAGQSLYWNSGAHGDTYGPIAYLAYVPFELFFPWHGAWDYLPRRTRRRSSSTSLRLGLVLLGRRLRDGREGVRLGLALGWAWAACPFTLLALMHAHERRSDRDALRAQPARLRLAGGTGRTARPRRRGEVRARRACSGCTPATATGESRARSPASPRSLWWS